jgi:hypothetical protein
MFFLIRCVFWLSVVFSTIFSAQSSALRQHTGAETFKRPVPQVSELAQNWIATLAFVKRQALKHCVETDCLPGQAAGHFLVSASRTVAQADVPLPPHRPTFAPAKSQRPTLEKSSRAEYVMEHSQQS